MYKKKAMEQHEKGFHKVVRQAGFFAKDLNLGLFDPFKDVNDGILLDEKDIDVEEEQDTEEQGDDANAQVVFCLFSSLLAFSCNGYVIMTMIFFPSMHMLSIVDEFCSVIISYVFSFV